MPVPSDGRLPPLRLAVRCRGRAAGRARRRPPCGHATVLPVSVLHAKAFDTGCTGRLMTTTRRVFLGNVVSGVALAGGLSRVRARQRRPLRDVVVVIPGVMGSVLQKDGKDVWAPTPHALARVLQSVGSDNGLLTLRGDTDSDADLGDGITAVRLMPDVHLMPGFWKIDGYGKSTTSSIAGSSSRTASTGSTSPTTGGVTTAPPPTASPRRCRAGSTHGAAIGQRRRQGHPGRPLDGRARRPLLPRSARGMEGRRAWSRSARPTAAR